MTVADEAVTVVDDPPVQHRGKGLSVGQGEHSWMLGSEVSLSDGNEIKNRDKGETGIKKATKWRKSHFHRLLMILQRLSTYSMLIYGDWDVILLFSGWSFIRLPPLGLVKSRMEAR